MFERKTIDDALINSQYNQYSFFRFSYFLITNSLFLVIEIIEFLLIRKSVSISLLLFVLFLRLLSGFLLKGWWGGLELLRESVRSKMSFHSLSIANEIIFRWCTLCIPFIFIVGAIVSGSFFYIDFSNLDWELKSFLFYYILLFFLTIAIGSFITTYNSGVYAIQRVYRPINSMILVGLINFIILIILWNAFGLIGLPIASIIGFLLQQGVRFFYIRKVYEGYELNPFKELNWYKFSTFLSNFPLRSFLSAFCAGCTLQLEFILVLFFFNEEDSITKNTLIYLFIQRQILQSLVQWRFLFYYDLKKARYGYFPLFYKRFVQKLSITSLIITFVSYAIGQVVAYFYYPDNYLYYSLLLALFFFPLSYASFLQIEAFCHNRYKDLIVSALLSIGFLFAFQFATKYNYIDQKWGILVSIFILLFYLLKPRLKPNPNVDSIKLQSIYALDWFRNRYENKPLNLVMLTFHQSYYHEVINKIMYEFSKSIHPSSLFVQTTNNQILLVELAKHSLITQDLIVKLTVGTIKKFQILKNITWMDCINKIQNEVFNEISDNQFYQKLGSCPDNKDIRDLFIETFPKGIVADLGKEEPLLPKLDSISHSSLIYRSTRLFFNTFPLKNELGSYMTAVGFFNSSTLFFANRNKENKLLFKKWRTYIHYLNWITIPQRKGQDSF